MIKLAFSEHECMHIAPCLLFHINITLLWQYFSCHEHEQFAIQQGSSSYYVYLFLQGFSLKLRSFNTFWHVLFTEIFRRVYEKSFEYGNVVKMWAGPQLFIFLVDPRDVEIILSSHVHIDKASEYRFFKPWLGDGLLISTGQKWRAHRKLIAPTFHLNVLKSFIDLFNANSREVSWYILWIIKSC